MVRRDLVAAGVHWRGQVWVVGGFLREAEVITYSALMHRRADRQIHG